MNLLPKQMTAMLQAKLHKAMANRLDLSSVMSAPLHQLVTANCDAIGCPPEFIFYPLLTSTAAFMGTNATITINSEWQEPAVMWFIVAARKDEKKTAALKRPRKPIEEIESKFQSEWEADTSKGKPTCPPQICIDHFSFEELHSVMKRNQCRILGFFDEMSTLYGQLDLFKHSGSTVDRKTLITLNGGGQWTRNFRSYSAALPKTSFNITGFIQPTFVERMLLSDDADGFNDRQLFDFPPERDVHFDELKIPVSSEVTGLKDIFEKIAMEHETEIVYSFSSSGLEAYKHAHDLLVDKKAKVDDEDVQGILSKARGYVARTAMILHCLEQAVQGVLSGDSGWKNEIEPATVQAAANIIDHLNNQKIILAGKDVAGGGSSCGDVLQGERIRKLLTNIQVPSDGFISPSVIGQKHISERVGSSYPVSKAVELMETAATMGFGEFVDMQTSSNRKLRKFRKRRLELVP